RGVAVAQRDRVLPHDRHLDACAVRRRVAGDPPLRLREVLHCSALHCATLMVDALLAADRESTTRRRLRRANHRPQREYRTIVVAPGRSETPMTETQTVPPYMHRAREFDPDPSTRDG